MCDIIQTMSYNGYSQMVSISLKKKNILSPTPHACCPLLALSSIQLMTGEPRPRYSSLQLLGVSGACAFYNENGR